MRFDVRNWADVNWFKYIGYYNAFSNSVSFPFRLCIGRLFINVVYYLPTLPRKTVALHSTSTRSFFLFQPVLAQFTLAKESYVETTMQQITELELARSKHGCLNSLAATTFGVDYLTFPGFVNRFKYLLLRDVGALNYKFQRNGLHSRRTTKTSGTQRNTS